jgi:hypothetical protein
MAIHSEAVKLRVEVCALYRLNRPPLRNRTLHLPVSLISHFSRNWCKSVLTSVDATVFVSILFCPSDRRGARPTAGREGQP